MKTLKEFINEVKKPTGDLKKACWDGYTAVGTKKKNGRTVPNCVPEEVVMEGHGPWGKMTQDKLDKIAKAKKREEKEKGVLRKPGSTLRKDTTNYVAKVNKLSEEELEENHIAIAMGKEMDDEGSMIMNQLDHMERSINMMRGVVKDPNMQIPAWVQSKVTLAADYIETAAGYMSSKNEEVVTESKKKPADVFHRGPAPNEIYVMKQIEKEKLEKEKLKKEEVEYLFDVIEEMVEDLACELNVDSELIWEELECISDEKLVEESAAWQRKEGKDPKGGLNRKGIASYRRENPGSKLSMAVTTKPSKLKPGSKAANRRKSFCARMGGMQGAMKKPNGEPSRKALALRKWNC